MIASTMINPMMAIAPPNRLGLGCGVAVGVIVGSVAFCAVTVHRNIDTKRKTAKIAGVFLMLSPN